MCIPVCVTQAHVHVSLDQCNFISCLELGIYHWTLETEKFFYHKDSHENLDFFFKKEKP